MMRLRDHSVYAPSQWDGVNAISHWLRSYTEWSLASDNDADTYYAYNVTLE